MYFKPILSFSLFQYYSKKAYVYQVYLKNAVRLPPLPEKRKIKK